MIVKRLNPLDQVTQCGGMLNSDLMQLRCIRDKLINVVLDLCQKV